ncbi:hypothetical protein C2G38_2062490 [Gigaspora rosea]|uniref:Uncharacterized protein n=1 Tax=Gigaspora rosea TaxID=44941 RepID=A0A397VXG1_9GLOM|nr:hypothetical protein C2G38_2062490 [Gigaspora rosea]
MTRSRLSRLLLLSQPSQVVSIPNPNLNFLNFYCEIYMVLTTLICFRILNYLYSNFSELNWPTKIRMVKLNITTKSIYSGKCAYSDQQYLKNYVFI